MSHPKVQQNASGLQPHSTHQMALLKNNRGGGEAGTSEPSWEKIKIRTDHLVSVMPIFGPPSYSRHQGSGLMAIWKRKRGCKTLQAVVIQGVKHCQF